MAGPNEHPEVTKKRASDRLMNQTSYSDVNVSPKLDEGFDPHYHAIEVQSDGDVEIQTGLGQEVKLSLVAGRIYPIEVQKVVSEGTSVPQGDIWLYAA
jgi:hypothetical protein